MIEINGKKLCENCFSEITEGPCRFCGHDGSEKDDVSALPVGARINKNIIIGRVMGRGGFGLTYLCYDTKKDKKIAVKEYFPYGTAYRSKNGKDVLTTDEKAAEALKKGAESFYREAETISQFGRSGGIVNIYDHFRENGTVYIAMEYLNGITLKKYVKDNGVISEGQAVYLLEKLAATLEVIHGRNVLHRDVSSDNIMICGEGEIKLIDFGAARYFDPSNPSSHTVVMKPGYTPIEQYTKKGRQGAWTDIYSLGASVYYALTGTLTDDPYERLENDEKFGGNSFSISSGLWDIIRKCTMVDPAERYSSASELKKAAAEVSEKIPPEPILLNSDNINTAAAPASYRAEKPQKQKFNFGRFFTAAALMLMIIITIVGAGRFAETNEENKHSNGITFPIDDEYPGFWKTGNLIEKSDLSAFKGDIKFTLELEPIEVNPWQGYTKEIVYAYGIRVKDMQGAPVEVSAFNTAVNDDGFFAFNKGLEEFVFVLPRSSLEAVNDGICFSSDNVMIRSAYAEEYDPSLYAAGKDALCYDMSSGRQKGYTDYIPKKDLESIGGDVLITVDELEVYWTEYPWYRPLDHDENFVHISGDNILPSWFGDQYLIGNGEGVDKLRFVISEEEIAGLDEKGLKFLLAGIEFKKVFIEKADS